MSLDTLNHASSLFCDLLLLPKTRCEHFPLWIDISLTQWFSQFSGYQDQLGSLKKKNTKVKALSYCNKACWVSVFFLIGAL